ncbi:MAG TPA: hypothetical protein VGU67_02960 [Edaphobacter sp.]|nr:hypothetical protein [Edaphobacter sp.]
MGRYFTSTAVHLATLALKDEQIATLRADLSAARADRIRSEESRDAAITKVFDLLTPKQPSAPEPRIPREPRPAPPTLDLAEIDPADTDAIRDIAISEMPSGKINASFLMQKIESVWTQVHLARAAKAERAKEVGTIPADVSTMIDEAIAKGKEQARTQ